MIPDEIKALTLSQVKVYYNLSQSNQYELQKQVEVMKYIQGQKENVHYPYFHVEKNFFSVIFLFQIQKELLSTEMLIQNLETDFKSLYPIKIYQSTCTLRGKLYKAKLSKMWCQNYDPSPTSIESHDINFTFKVFIFQNNEFFLS